MERIQPIQFAELGNIISRCQPLKLERIKQKQEMLQKRAEEIMKELTRTEQTQYMTDIAKKRTVTQYMQV
jgi:hypothetical protein